MGERMFIGDVEVCPADDGILTAEPPHSGTAGVSADDYWRDLAASVQDWHDRMVAAHAEAAGAATGTAESVAQSYAAELRLRGFSATADGTVVNVDLQSRPAPLNIVITLGGDDID